MPKWNAMTPEKHSEIKKLISAGKLRKDIAALAGVSVSTVDKLKGNKYRNVQPRRNGPNALPAETYAQIRKELLAGKLTLKAIADKNGVSVSAITRLKHREGLPIKQGGGKYGHLEPQIKKMIEQNIPASEIARKLKMSVPAVNYYLYKKFRPQKLGGIHDVSTNGAVAKVGSTLKVAHIVGIALAERERATEKVIEAVSARFNVSATLLRSQLSRLL